MWLPLNDMHFLVFPVDYSFLDLKFGLDPCVFLSTRDAKKNSNPPSSISRGKVYSMVEVSEHRNDVESLISQRIDEFV